MQRYFLKITAPRDAFNAEGKAPADVENILRQEGFKPLEIRAPPMGRPAGHQCPLVLPATGEIAAKGWRIVHPISFLRATQPSDHTENPPHQLAPHRVGTRPRYVARRTRGVRTAPAKSQATDCSHRGHESVFV